MSGRPVDPIARFMAEHDEALTNLAGLNRAARTLEEEGPSATTLKRMRSAIAFLQKEVDIHNRHEEEALFPVLERYVEGPTAAMKAEHRMLRRELRRLQAALRLVSATTTPGRESILQLRTQASEVVQAFVNHIHKENQILFPLVQKFLTKDALREIARRIT